MAICASPPRRVARARERAGRVGAGRRQRARLRVVRRVAAGGALGALVDLGTRRVVVPARLVVGAVAARTRAVEGAVQVDARSVGVTVVRAGRGQRCLERALVDVTAVEAIAPVAGAIAHACVAERCGHGEQRVGARGLRRARVRAERTLVDIGAVHAVARVALGACALVAARDVGAELRAALEAVVRALGALVDLRARRRALPISARADARAPDEVRRRRVVAAEAVGSSTAATGGARTMAGGAA